MIWRTFTASLGLQEKGVGDEDNMKDFMGTFVQLLLGPGGDAFEV